MTTQQTSGAANDTGVKTDQISEQKRLLVSVLCTKPDRLLLDRPSRYDPVTFTIQVQDADACTTSVWDPRLDWAVTDCPDAPVSLTAAVPLGADPAGVTNTWNDGPEAGAGLQLNAHPMFQPAAVVVNGVLVQLP